MVVAVQKLEVHEFLEDIGISQAIREMDSAFEWNSVTTSKVRLSLLNRDPD